MQNNDRLDARFVTEPAASEHWRELKTLTWTREIHPLVSYTGLILSWFTIGLLLTWPWSQTFIYTVQLCVVFSGRLFNRVDLIKPVSNVRPWSRPYVRPSTKSFLDCSEIWHIGRGQWVMHDGMRYDRIQGQGHESFEVGNPVIFKCYLLCHLEWELATDHWFLNWAQYLNLIGLNFLIYLSFCITWFWVCVYVRPSTKFLPFQWNLACM